MKTFWVDIIPFFKILFKTEVQLNRLFSINFLRNIQLKLSLSLLQWYLLILLPTQANVSSRFLKTMSSYTSGFGAHSKHYTPGALTASVLGSAGSSPRSGPHGLRQDCGDGSGFSGTPQTLHPAAAGAHRHSSLVHSWGLIWTALI